MNNKTVLLFVYNGSAEVDWILPVLHELRKNNIKIFTFFKSKYAYENLKSNRELYFFWNKINTIKYIDSLKRVFFFKFAQKILRFLKINNTLIINKIHNPIFLKKIFDFETDPIFIFSEFGYNSGWIPSCKIFFNKSVIVHYPSTPFVYLSKPQKPRFALRGDILFLGSKLSKRFFARKIISKKIFISGNPSFDKKWVKKIINSYSFDFNYSELSKSKKFITIAYSSFFDEFNEQTNIKLTKQLNDIMSVINKFKDLIIIFKIHPRKNNPGYLKILEKYNKKIWVISKTHLFKLAKISKVYLHPGLSATLLDSILVGTPAIQYWPIDKKLQYDSNNTFEKINLTVKVQNKDELYQQIKNILERKNLKIFNDQKKNFFNIFFSKDNKSTIKNFVTKLHKISKLKY